MQQSGALPHVTSSELAIPWFPPLGVSLSMMVATKSLQVLTTVVDLRPLPSPCLPLLGVHSPKFTEHLCSAHGCQPLFLTLATICPGRAHHLLPWPLAMHAMKGLPSDQLGMCPAQLSSRSLAPRNELLEILVKGMRVDMKSKLVSNGQMWAQKWPET